MKKTLLGLMAIVLMAVVCVGFSACGSDGDDNGNGGGNGGGSTSNALVGTWSRNYSTADVPNAKEVYTFNNNGSGAYKNAYQTATFVYSAANGYIAVKIRYNDSSSTIDDVWSYTINGKTLTLNGNQYQKQ